MHALALFFASLFFSLSTSSINNAEAQKPLSGFTIDLIHRNSPQSPFYNSSMTKSQFFRNAALRSISRFSMKDSSQELAETDVAPAGGAYLMRIYIGTPPVETWAIADTGSDVVWVQCSPCTKCYPQNAPLFDPTKSSSYMAVPCDSKPCALLPKGYSKCGTSNQCIYGVLYGDNSHTVGDLATDSINFGTSGGQSVSFPKSVFGCGRDNAGTFQRDDAGIVGLGNGPLSLVSQLGPQIGRKFSYCLIPFGENSSSKLRFGEDATISGEVLSTPLVTYPGAPSSYYIFNLQGITIGQKTAPTGQSEGNILIDSGTTLTLLESSYYSMVEALVKEAIGKEAVQNPAQGFNLCYPKETKGVDFVFHLMGADLSVQQDKLFLPVDDLLCFGVLPKRGLSIFGNIAQTNFQVEYDLEAQKLSFAPTDCTKQ